jgi:alkanesulfonate monooxygenase SsuD/methylene tetrahydromethanopterin reductase-like flavin-dependent oxidoreductase (luciferase family)
MRLTLFIHPEHRPDDDLAARFAEHMAQVRLARDLGAYDNISIGHHMCYGSAVWFPPLETLTRLAADAGDMTLATSMLVLPLFHPLHVAQQAALLDAVSGGKLIFGVAPGWTQDEFRILDIDHGRRFGRYREAVTLIQRLWTEDKVDFEGKHFTADGLSLALKPVQRPRPRMWFGGSVKPAVERTARLADTTLGDSWVASSHLTGEVITEQAAVFREALEALGKPMPEDFPVLRNVFVAPDRETAIREAGPHIEESNKVFGDWGLFTDIVGAGKSHLSLSELLADRIIIGSPEDCAEALVRLARATGFTRLIAKVSWMGMDQRLVLRTIELLAERVMPLVRKELGKA